MRIKDLVKELEETKIFENFKKENPKAFFTAAFLIINLEDKTEEIQLDYFIPNENKIAAFPFPWQAPKIHDEVIAIKNNQTKGVPPEEMTIQSTNIKVDIDDLEKTYNKIAKEKKINIIPTKIIAILKDNIWNLTYTDNILGIVRIKINAIKKELIDFNKGSLMDFALSKK